MCINDECAVAAMTGAEKLGRRVPQELSVVGCNNIKIAGFFRPALTTLSIDIRSMVETALDLLFDDMRVPPDRRRRDPVKILLPASLVVRDSTAPARKTA
jgi:DNA-binding LacI/PurR family transcriptional regulator